MDLRQLEIFVKVAELKSFSKAALALRLTQPTVSEHIRTLEQELGVRLLDRLGRGAEATRAGQLLVTHATRILSSSAKRDRPWTSSRESSWASWPWARAPFRANMSFRPSWAASRRSFPISRSPS